MLYIISYDLHLASSTTYDYVEEAMKVNFNSRKILTTTWLIFSNLDPQGLYNSLAQYLPQNSKLFVMQSRGFWGDVDYDVEIWLEANGIVLVNA